MANVHKPRFGLVSVVVVTMTAVPTLGCARGSDTAADPPPAAGAPAGESAPHAAGADSPSGGPLVQALDARQRRAAEPAEVDPPNPLQADGTDTAHHVDPVPASPAAVSRLDEFGRHYLGFDYRSPPQQRTEALAGLVTPALLAELAAPLPAALQEALSREQRVDTARLDSALLLEELAGGGAVYRAVFTITESAVPDGSREPATADRRQALTIVIGPGDLVEDVR